MLFEGKVEEQRKTPLIIPPSHNSQYHLTLLERPHCKWKIWGFLQFSDLGSVPRLKRISLCNYQKLPKHLSLTTEGWLHQTEKSSEPHLWL